MLCQERTKDGAVCFSEDTFLTRDKGYGGRTVMAATSACKNHLKAQHNWLLNCFHCLDITRQATFFKHRDTKKEG